MADQPTATDETTSSRTRRWDDRISPGPVLVVAGLVVSFWLVGHLAAPGPTSDWDAFDWGAATAAATAYGTLALALVTWRLVALTRADASGTLELARLAEREQDERRRSLERERIERLVDAVNRLVDAAIIAERVPSQGAAVPVAQARLRTEITISGMPIEKLGSTELLTRTPQVSVEAQGQSATFELAALLEEINQP
jgi:hypothetical protein